jgi:hypothetical protein
MLVGGASIGSVGLDVNAMGSCLDFNFGDLFSSLF